MRLPITFIHYRHSGVALLRMLQLKPFFLGAISGCMLLSLSYYVFTIYEENKEYRRVLLSDERVDHWSDKALQGRLDMNRKRRHLKVSPLDNKKDCNGQTYLSLKYKYKQDGGVTFKSCSLPERLLTKCQRPPRLSKDPPVVEPPTCGTTVTIMSST